MNQFVEIFSRCFRWLRRFRKRRGYGIHSPFAFNLVTGVIYESWDYYAYEGLYKLRNRSNAAIREKDDRLLFRLVNNSQPRNGIIISHQLGITEKYLASGCLNTVWNVVSPDDVGKIQELLNTLGSIDFLYIDDPCHTQCLLETALPFVNDRSLFVIHGIRHNSALYTIWQLFIQNPQVRVTFDLYDFGLIYFEERLNKEDYIINYF